MAQISSSVSAIFKNLATLALLTLLLPFNLGMILVSLVSSLFQKKPEVATTPVAKKRILITGAKMTKALQLARSFHHDGHEVYLVETHKYWLSGHRFSRAVKGFFTVPVPEKEPDAYCQALVEIAQAKDIDLFVPVSSPIASYYDSLAKRALEPYCESIHLDPEETTILDDKHAFCSKAKEFGLSAPKVFRITDPQQILDFDFENDGSKYIVKSIPYDSVLRLDLTRLPFPEMEEYVRSLPISESKPWVMQEFIRGQEYCFHATARKGKIRLHCCSESSPFQVNYEQVDNPAIYQWVATFIEKMNLTGQVCFDMIQVEDGTVYPIECNPRLHSAITMFHDHPGVANAYLTDGKPGEAMQRGARADARQSSPTQSVEVSEGNSGAIAPHDLTEGLRGHMRLKPLSHERHRGAAPIGADRRKAAGRAAPPSEPSEKAMAQSAVQEAPITPLADSKPTYWTYHELWRFLGIRSLKELDAWWQKVSKGTDAILTPEDPLPFLMLHNWQIPLLLLDNLRRLKGWVKIDFNIGKLVEIGGD